MASARALCLLFALALIGCGDTGPDGDGEGGPVGDSGVVLRPGAVQVPVRGERSPFKLVFAVPRLEDSLHAVLLGPPSWRHLVYEPLVRASETGFVPCLARSWEVSADSLRWTFVLRRGVCFSDGSPLTARDVQFSVLRLDAPRHPRAPAAALTLGLRALPGMRAAGDDTLHFVLPRHDSAFLERLSLLGIAPRRSAQSARRDYRGTGPFVLDRRGIVFDAGGNPQRYQLSRHAGRAALGPVTDGYWKFDLAGQQLPYAEAVHLRAVRDPLRRFREGSLHAVELFPQRLDRLLSSARRYTFRLAYLHGQTDDLELHFHQGPADTTEAAACRVAWLRDPAFRQALACCVERRELLDRALGGRDRPPPAGAFAYDPRTADSLLTTLGLVDRDGDGIREDVHGHKVELVAEQSPSLLLDTVFGQLLGRRGIAISFRPLAVGPLEDAPVGYDIGLRLARRQAPGSLRRAIRVRQAAPPTMRAGLDVAFAEAFAEPDARRRLERFRAIEQRVAARLRVIPLLVLPVYVAGHDQLRGWSPSARVPHNWHNIEELYVLP